MLTTEEDSEFLLSVTDGRGRRLSPTLTARQAGKKQKGNSKRGERQAGDDDTSAEERA